MRFQTELIIRLLAFVPLLMLGAVAVTFALFNGGFLDPRNLLNIAVQASSRGRVASGITFVLITAGIDLSVGSVMFLSAAIAGKIAVSGEPVSLAIAAVLLIGVVCGAVNGALITRFRLPPFIVTLAFLYVGRGLALYITETRALNLPHQLLVIATSSLAGIPIPVWILILTATCAQIALSRTQWGRQLYATGNSATQARLAGIPVNQLHFTVYVVSGFAAALGGLVSVAQLGAVSPTFGYQREFAAIAAAVLGGTSLFGGRGRVFPGTILGAVLIQTVENGLVVMNADPYLYPLVMAIIIFVAVLLDAVRTGYVANLNQRKIRAFAQPA